MKSKLNFCPRVGEIFVEGIGDVIEDHDLGTIMFKAYFSKRMPGKPAKFFSEILPLTAFRKIKPGNYYTKSCENAPLRRVWLKLTPSKIENIRSLPPIPEKQLLSELNKKSRADYPTKATLGLRKKRHQQALHLYQNHLKVRNKEFDIIIPCSEIVRFYMCTSGRLTKLVFSPGLATALSDFENGILPIMRSGSAWLASDLRTLESLASTSSGRASARLPYKHMLMNRIQKTGQYSTSQTSILTRFPLETETMICASYKWFSEGIENYSDRDTAVIQSIHTSMTYKEWLNHIMNAGPKSFAVRSDIWDEDGGHWDRKRSLPFVRNDTRSALEVYAHSRLGYTEEANGELRTFLAEIVR